MISSPLSPWGHTRQSWQLLCTATIILRNWCLELRWSTLAPAQNNGSLLRGTLKGHMDKAPSMICIEFKADMMKPFITPTKCRVHIQPCDRGHGWHSFCLHRGYISSLLVCIWVPHTHRRVRCCVMLTVTIHHVLRWGEEQSGCPDTSVIALKCCHGLAKVCGKEPSAGQALS